MYTSHIIEFDKKSITPQAYEFTMTVKEKNLFIEQLKIHLSKII